MKFVMGVSLVDTRSYQQFAIPWSMRANFESAPPDNKADYFLIDEAPEFVLNELFR